MIVRLSMFPSFLADHVLWLLRLRRILVSWVRKNNDRSIDRNKSPRIFCCLTHLSISLCPITDNTHFISSNFIHLEDLSFKGLIFRDTSGKTSDQLYCLSTCICSLFQIPVNSLILCSSLSTNDAMPMLLFQMAYMYVNNLKVKCNEIWTVFLLSKNLYKKVSYTIMKQN